MLSVKIPCGRAVSSKHRRTHRLHMLALTLTCMRVHHLQHYHSTVVFTEASDGNKRFSSSAPPPHTHTHTCAQTPTHTDKKPTKCSIFCRCVVIYERCFSQQADSPVWNASFHKSILHSHFSASPPSPPRSYFLFSPLCRTPSASVDTYTLYCMCVHVRVSMCVCERASIWMGRGKRDTSRLCLQSG